MQIHSDKFWWNHEGGSAEASDLQLSTMPADIHLWWKDADRSTHFTLKDVHRDDEGDVLNWEYRCQSGEQLTIFND